MRTLLVTGASTGIGKATALRMERGGWRVFAGVRREEDGRALREQASGRLEPLLLDVTDPDAIAAAAAQIGVAVGGAGLDGLVNNAGIGVMGPLETMPLQEFRRQIEVNLTGQVAVTQALLPLIRAAAGRLVFVSSIGGRMAMPFGGPYHASKFGLEAVADCLRQELRPWGIGVALIEPGSIDTPIWERGERIVEEMENVPDAQERLYGPTIERFRAAVKRTATRGIAPERVAAAIDRALTSRRPRSRYLVGADARAQALARGLLPDRAVDRLVARAIGI